MKFLVLVLLAFTSSTTIAQKIDDLIDYESLDHEIQLLEMRAGNHDESGENEYFFQVNMHALAVLKEERKKAFKDRLQVVRDLETFGDTIMKSLSFMKVSSPPPTLRITGESLRNLASEAMRTLKVSESQVAILIRIQLIEKNKQFIFLGEDSVIGSVSYYIIPESLPHKPIIKDEIIEITDSLGAHVRFQLRYDLLDPKKKKRK